MFRRHLFRKVAVLGTGLLGGSVALALKEKKLAEKIVGTSRHEASLRTALEKGVIDEACNEVGKAIQGADFVVLASPVQVIIDQIKDISKHLRRGCLVTDVGSTKAAIVEVAEKHFPPHVLFVGSHPMAGSDKSGVAHAAADLFKDSLCLMTPTEKTNKVARDKVKHLWTTLGAEVKYIDPLKHDEALAYVSHLPHIVAFGLIRAVPDDFLQYGAAGLRDTTRVAASSPKMWSDICLSNYRHVLKAIDESVRTLSDIRKAVVDHDESTLINCFTQAKAKRETLEKKA